MPIIPNDTVSSILNLVNRAHPISIVQPPLSRARFALDASGVAGFFGGDTAVRAMATVYLIPQRRWLGWYNAPGAYEVAKQYSAIGKSPIFDALFPGGDGDPGKIFTVVDRQVDRKYTPLYSITRQGPLPIGPLGLLFMRKVFQMPITNDFPPQTIDSMDRFRITFIALYRKPSGQRLELYFFPSKSNIFAITTILISVGGCVACALVGDWFCFASIAIGIIANGIGCLVIGSGGLHLTYDKLTQDKVDTPGDVLLNADTDSIVLLGTESVVSPLTRGRFTLKLRRIPGSASTATAVESRSCKWEIPMDYLIHISVFLLLFQFLAQLLLIPQGTLFGQLMFIGTLGSSWVYHLYLSTLRLDLQTQALFRKLSIDPKEDIYQNTFSTRMEAVVFACLAFRSVHLFRLNPKALQEANAPVKVEKANTPMEGEEVTNPVQVDEATNAVDEAKKAVDEYIDKMQKKERQKQDSRKAKNTKIVDAAFHTLLYTLLPEETPMWQAFKESLVRKMGEDDLGSYMREENPSFQFTPRDARVQNDQGDTMIVGKDLEQLHMYQGEANQGLVAWKKFYSETDISQLTKSYK